MNWVASDLAKWPHLALLFVITDRQNSVSDPTLELQHDKKPETVTVALGGQKDALPRWEQKVSFEEHDGAGQQTANRYTWVVAGEQPAHRYTSIDEVIEAIAKGELEKSVGLEEIAGRVEIDRCMKAIEGEYCDRGETLEWIIEEVSQLLVGPGQLLRDALTEFRYLGPLRETPSRDHAPPRFPDPSR
jgi:hypothetical protein